MEKREDRAENKGNASLQEAASAVSQREISQGRWGSAFMCVDFRLGRWCYWYLKTPITWHKSKIIQSKHMQRAVVISWMDLQHDVHLLPVDITQILIWMPAVGWGISTWEAFQPGLGICLVPVINFVLDHICRFFISGTVCVDICTSMEISEEWILELQCIWL